MRSPIITLICLSGLILGFVSCSAALAQDGGEGTSVISWHYNPEDPVVGACLGELVLPAGCQRCQNVSRSVTIPGLENRIIPGEPVVPFRTARILIPYGHEVQDIEVFPGEKKNLGKIFIEPGQDALPISSMLDDISRPEPTPLNETTYGSMDPYPRDFYSVLGIQEKEGYKILYINLYPIKYIPKTKDAYYFGSFDINVTTKPAETLDRGLFRGAPEGKKAVIAMVDNPGEAATYPADLMLAGSSPLLNGQYDYIIITDQYLKSAPGPYNFQALADHKGSRGIKTAIVTVEDIYTAYDGVDKQEKIRNFIRDAYMNNGITYVLLGGDSDGASIGGECEDAIVPVRGLWAWSYEGNPPNIPSDLYYACLDGSYDYNGNGIYGEPTDGSGGGDVDLLAEVYVGRAPVDSHEEVNNFVRKTIDYETSSGPYLRKVWLVGEYLGFGGAGDWGGNYKDEIKSGSSANGYNTKGFSDDFEKHTLYERDRDWSRRDLTGIINDGLHVINHLGHANPGSVMKLGNGDVDALSNSRYFFGYTQGCYAGSFDNRMPDGYYLSSDCVLEHFVTGPHGAFGFIGNSRYGWGRRSSTDGPSQRYDRQFWDAIFEEGIKNIGRANQDSKEDNLGSIDRTSDGNVMRYCYYQINLLGDPETPFHLQILSEHDIRVADLHLPSYTRPDKAVEINAVIENKGTYGESDLVVRLMENDAVRESHTIPELASGTSKSIGFSWSSGTEGVHVLKVHVVPVSGETDLDNNYGEMSIKVLHAGGMILLVDDDDGASYETYYERALSANGYNYVKIEGPPTLDELSNFDCVIWFTGRDFVTTLTDSDQANLATYLDGGGNLFLTGQDIGYDIGDTDFYEDYIHAEYIKDSTGQYILDGVAKDPISDGMTIGISGRPGANNQYWPSEISPVGDASDVFNYRDDGCGAIRTDTGTYEVIYFAFGFEAINDEADRNEVMDNVIRELSGSSEHARLAISKEADLTYMIKYNITVTNTGDVTLYKVNVTDDRTELYEQIPSLEPGQSRSFYPVYTVAEYDVDEAITNTAETIATDADGNRVGPESASVTVTTVCESITKTAETMTVDTLEDLVRPTTAPVASTTAYETHLEIAKETNRTTVSVGDVIEYRITVTNAGDGVLYKVNVTDDLTGLHVEMASLEPGESQSFITTYKVTEEAICDDIINTAEVGAVDPRGNRVGPLTASVTVYNQTGEMMRSERIMELEFEKMTIEFEKMDEELQTFFGG